MKWEAGRDEVFEFRGKTIINDDFFGMAGFSSELSNAWAITLVFLRNCLHARTGASFRRKTSKVAVAFDNSEEKPAIPKKSSLILVFLRNSVGGCAHFPLRGFCCHSI